MDAHLRAHIVDVALEAGRRSLEANPFRKSEYMILCSRSPDRASLGAKAGGESAAEILCFVSVKTSDAARGSGQGPESRRGSAKPLKRLKTTMRNYSVELALISGWRHDRLGLRPSRNVGRSRPRPRGGESAPLQSCRTWRRSLEKPHAMTKPRRMTGSMPDRAEWTSAHSSGLRWARCAPGRRNRLQGLQRSALPLVSRALRLAAIAQLVRALDCGSRGPPFEPGWRYQPDRRRRFGTDRAKIGRRAAKSHEICFHPLQVEIKDISCCETYRDMS